MKSLKKCIAKRKSAFFSPYFSLSTMAAGSHWRILSCSFPCSREHTLNCVCRYCLISFDTAQYGIVLSLYWSSAAAIWALSSFSELQITTRDSPKMRKYPLNYNFAKKKMKLLLLILTGENSLCISGERSFNFQSWKYQSQNVLASFTRSIISMSVKSSSNWERL